MSPMIDTATEQEQELTQHDPSIYTEHYADAASDLGGSDGAKTTPPPGRYILRLPETLLDDCFVTRTSGDGTQTYLRITLDNGTEGLVITEGTHQDRQARYIRISTQLLPAMRWDAEAQEMVPILNEDGSQKYYSEGADLVKSFGLPVPSSKSGWMLACQGLVGQIIPHPVYLTWEGRAPGTLDANGYARRVYAREFKTTAGGYAPYIELTADVAFERKSRGQVFPVNPGDTYRVYPNLALGRRALAMPKRRTTT